MLNNKKQILFLRISQALTFLLGWPAFILIIVGWGIPLAISFLLFAVMVNKLIRDFKGETILNVRERTVLKASIILWGLSFLGLVYMAASLSNLDTTGQPSRKSLFVTYPIIVGWTIVLWSIAKRNTKSTPAQLLPTAQPGIYPDNGAQQP